MTLSLSKFSNRPTTFQLVGVFVVATVAALLIQILLSSTASAVRERGYLLIYNEQGRFDQVRVIPNNAAINDEPTWLESHRCGKTFGSLNSAVDANWLERKLSTNKISGAVKPKRITCSPATGSGQGVYRVQYGKRGHPYTRNPILVNINTNTCTKVYPDPDKIGNGTPVALSGTQCATDTASDTPTSLASTTTINKRAGSDKYLSKSNKYIQGVIDIAPQNGESLTKTQCNASTATVNYAPGKSQTVKVKKVNKTISGTVYGRCQAKFSSNRMNLTPGTYSVSASYSGSAYLGASSDTISVTIPKRR